MINDAGAALLVPGHFLSVWAHTEEAPNVGHTFNRVTLNGVNTSAGLMEVPTNSVSPIAGEI